jgi:hypothetical protein
MTLDTYLDDITSMTRNKIMISAIAFALYFYYLLKPKHKIFNYLSSITLIYAILYGILSIHITNIYDIKQINIINIINILRIFYILTLFTFLIYINIVKV